MPRLMEVLEFLDDTGEVMVKRMPEGDDFEIKWGAQLTVRENQAAVFMHQGQVADVFGPGRYTLKTWNIPILTKLLTSLGYGTDSPFRAEVYFVSLKLFRNLKWGTKAPILFRDAELDMVRLRSFGIFSIKVSDAKHFVTEIVGTEGLFSTDEIEDYLKSIIISRFADMLGEQTRTVLDLPTQYDELGGFMQQRLGETFNERGLQLVDFYINAISLPPEVEAAIDEKSGMNAIGNMNTYLQYKTARAVEDSAENPGGDAGSGVGMGAGLGMGMMMPGMMANAFQQGGQGGQAGQGAGGGGAAAGGGATCPSCNAGMPAAAKFCPSCGESTTAACPDCGEAAPAGARFCPSCGTSMAAASSCAHCKADVPPGSKFCPECGKPPA